MLVSIEVGADFEGERSVIQGRLYRIWKKTELIFIYLKTPSDLSQSIPNLHIFSEDGGCDAVEIHFPM